MSAPDEGGVNTEEKVGETEGDQQLIDANQNDGETTIENTQQNGGEERLEEHQVKNENQGASTVDNAVVSQTTEDVVQKEQENETKVLTETEGTTGEVLDSSVQTERTTGEVLDSSVQTERTTGEVLDSSVQTEGRVTPSKPTEQPTDDSNVSDHGSQATGAASRPHIIAPPVSQTDLPSASTITAQAFNIQVKFVIMPEGEVITLTCSNKQSISELRKHLASELGQPSHVILMLHDDKLMVDEGLLSDMGVQPGQMLHIELQSNDPINHPLKVQPSTQPQARLPPFIIVKSERDGKLIEINIEIIQERQKKEFLGGFKHRLTGTEYHNAAAQTMPKTRVPSPVERFHRDTQTYKLRNRTQQTTNTTSTQMTKDGCYVSNVIDRVVIPGQYETAEQYHNKILEKVIILQTYWRRWLALKYVENLKEDRRKSQQWERQEELRKQREKAERIRKEWERRLNPKTKEDFDLLYSHLEKWRQEEMERIEQLYSGPERKAALIGLVEQEAYLIASIDRHKIAAGTENTNKKIKSFLDKAAAPKRWRAFDGKITEMDTPYTIRAQELRDIYNTLCMKYLTQDERLDVLLTLKHTVKEHDCKLTHEIIELIDREADLLMRGVKENNLEGLRKRISTLFLQYCKTPLFNPEAARLIKVPQDPSILRKNIYFCPSCNRYLPSTEFKLSLNSSVVGRCRKCLKLDNDARLRQDLLQYRKMLAELRRDEENFEDGSKISYLLQEPDLRYLVENIWNSQSALSAHTDLFDLVLVRWNKHEEWSPWNCILLTKEEASSHRKLENVTEAYGRMFIGKVLHKHLLARNYFSRLPGMAEHMKTKITGRQQSTPQPVH